MQDDSVMPFGLSRDPAEFEHYINGVKARLRKRFGQGVPATSAVDLAPLKSLEEMRAGKTPTRFWVRVTRRAIDLLRRAQRYERTLTKVRLDQSEPGGDPAEEVVARELQERLQSAAQALTETEREVWLLYCEGRAESEIATMQNRSLAAVRMALSRARQKVRDHLAADDTREE